MVPHDGPAHQRSGLRDVIRNASNEWQ